MFAVADLRLRLGLTQEQLAKLLGLNGQTISRNEQKDPRGIHAIPYLALSVDQQFDDLTERFLAICKDTLPGVVIEFVNRCAAAPGLGQESGVKSIGSVVESKPVEPEVQEVVALYNAARQIKDPAWAEMLKKVIDQLKQIAKVSKIERLRRGQARQ